MTTTITHGDIYYLRLLFVSRIAGKTDDQDRQIVKWLTEILDSTAARPNWPHTITIAPQVSVSGFAPQAPDPVVISEAD